MIFSVWKPKTKSINKKQTIVYYILLDNRIIYKKGSSGYKVIWKCDNKDCKHPDKIHSINRCHLNINRSKYCNEDIQICHSCQFTGDKNPRYGDNRKWEDFMDDNQLKLMKHKYSNNWLNNNPSKLKEVKEKKNQFIINFDNVYPLLKEESYELINLIGDNKHSLLKIKCPNNHNYETKYINWKIGSRCSRCYYDSIMIPEEEIDNYKKYCKKVRSLTLINYNKYKDILDPNRLKSREFHLDHIYSVCDGYKNNIDPIIISSIVNLRIISQKENSTKSSKSFIKLDELLKLFNESKK